MVENIAQIDERLLLLSARGLGAIIARDLSGRALKSITSSCTDAKIFKVVSKHAMKGGEVCFLSFFLSCRGHQIAVFAPFARGEAPHFLTSFHPDIRPSLRDEVWYKDLKELCDKYQRYFFSRNDIELSWRVDKGLMVIKRNSPCLFFLKFVNAFNFMEVKKISLLRVEAYKENDKVTISHEQMKEELPMDLWELFSWISIKQAFSTIAGVTYFNQRWQVEAQVANLIARQLSGIDSAVFKKLRMDMDC